MRRFEVLLHVVVVVEIQPARRPQSICGDLKSYMLLKFNAREEHREVLEEFPPVFRARLFRHLYRPVIQQSYLLSGAIRCGDTVSPFAAIIH